MIRPYEIHVSEEILSRTEERLRSIHWPETPETPTGGYGLPLGDVRDVLEHWVQGYSWRTWEERLNSRPHFLAEIDGLDVHFWHIRGAREDSIPILLLHGWPGSIVEYWNVIGALTDPDSHGAPGAPTFDVVLAELPGFGFSGKPQGERWSIARIAEAMHQLMHCELGYTRYGVHGGDWGAMVAVRMARLHPESVAGIQVNLPFTSPHGDFHLSSEQAARSWQIGGYSHVQATVPDALTIGMADSPLALTAWIIEKFSSWTDNDGSLVRTIDVDLLVTNLNFYWLTSSIVSSTRLYADAASDGLDLISPPRVPVPAALLVFPKEPFLSPREWLDDVYDIRRYTVFEAGGHFPGLEQPDTVVSEIREFFPPIYGGN